MKILILGSSGFVGRNMYEYFNDKYDVKAPKHNELDVAIENDVYMYLKKNTFDVVINALDVRNNDNCYFEQRMRMYANLRKHTDMYGKMIYFGSGAEYARELPIDNISEEMFDRKIPSDTYGFCLHQMNMDALRSDNIFNFRLFGIFGKYELWKRRFISNAICKAIYGLPITIQQDRVMDYLHIDDLCKMVEWACENKLNYHDYNATSGKKYRLTELAEMINRQLGGDVPIVVRKDGFSEEYTSSNKRILEEMSGFEIEDINESISKLLSYYIGHRNEINKEELLY